MSSLRFRKTNCIITIFSKPKKKSCIFEHRPNTHEFQNIFKNEFKQLPVLTYGPLPKKVHPTCAWLTEMWLPQLPQLRPPLSGGRIPALGCNRRRGKRVCPPDLAVSGTRLGGIRVCLVCSTYMWFLFGFGKNGWMQLLFLNLNFHISNWTYNAWPIHQGHSGIRWKG